jgi:hypothetical protein
MRELGTTNGLERNDEPREFPIREMPAGAELPCNEGRSSYRNSLRRLGRLVLATALLFGVTAAVGSAADAATCRNLGVYTDYWYNTQHNPANAPAIYIWNGAVRPDPKKIKISYNGSLGREIVPSPGDWGVRTDAPQAENRSGWYVYYIATRWYSYHVFWNDDWRWSVSYCS